MNLRIHELVIFNQTTKIDAHEEKYFCSNTSSNHTKGHDFVKLNR